MPVPTLRILILLPLLAGALVAQPATTATVRGVIMDPAGQQPLASAPVTLQQQPDGTTLRTGVTDGTGAFAFTDLPFGEYKLSYGPAAGPVVETPGFVLDAARLEVDLGRLSAASPAGEKTLELERMEVSARREAFYNNLDRKVYNVGKDVQSVTGSASDLLQGIPSIQVDVEGEVSLRGDSNVLILVNGKPSALMGRNRAEALEQMSADRIARVEIITNPSARYKPDGTAGVINLVLKDTPEPGYAATLRASVGNDRRYNTGLTASYNPGRFNFFGSASVRQDDRRREGTDLRLRRDGAGSATTQHTSDRSRPRSRFLEGGIDFQASDATELGVSFSHQTRSLTRDYRQSNLTLDGAGALAADQERNGTGRESEDELEIGAELSHKFAKHDGELSLTFRQESETEKEDERYTNRYLFPTAPDALDRTRVVTEQDSLEFSADYTQSLGGDARLETGYAGERESSDVDQQASFLDPATGAWTDDAARTNRFGYESTLHALYATYGRPLGDFGAQAGLRFEHATVDTDQVTAALRDRNTYARLYPTLHLTHDLTGTQQLQLNYSHRVNRPDGDDLNPYPEFQDPFNLRAGNPRLVPEDIHSIEAGYQYRKDDVTYLASLYQRYRYNGITEVTRFINETTLLTTSENLATSRSSGLELGATARLWDRVALNFSANVYRNQIDARSLGFAGRRATVAWDAKLNAQWAVTQSFLLQLNTGYRAARLTPQGERRPNHVTNLGLRHNFKDRRTSLVLTVSDVFDSLRDVTVLDTPELRREVTRRRSARIVFIGFSYRFGGEGKDRKTDMEFDDAI